MTEPDPAVPATHHSLAGVAAAYQRRWCGDMARHLAVDRRRFDELEPDEPRRQP